ncbi:RluA family pseudouridine synthase [Caenibacillus caldisaponilyticus]|uniref:RluA family pseudouridine synthase n=1 Tax=Caenibacillus caldisaponilyticus TaxID=1674942 RepID=UPI0009885E13|nr:RluA family pseudouridine synthase [Caenibacillus caldisaponilyticus]
MTTERKISVTHNRSKTRTEKNIEVTIQEPAQLLTFLRTLFPKRGRNAVKAMLARGQVTVDDRVVTRHDHPLEPGQIVRILQGKPKGFMKLYGLRILYEDDDLIVVDKASGLLTIASDKEKERTAYRQLMTYVQKGHPDRRIFIVHRLDRDTSGVLVFAKKADVKERLQNEWKTLVFERRYVALVEGEVKKPSGTITSWLKESKTHLMYSSNRPGDGKKAVTHYKVIRANRSFSLLDVRLETGRKNQIRVHMKDIGHPVVGDKKYGATSKAIGRLGLHARVLAFKHPTTGETLRFETPIPEAFLSPFQSED